jgi:UDP-2-acetamido-3-amino-2,3-dideoxy-glucuronate N-acetyltransferase
MTVEVFVHPTALVDAESIGAGTRIWAFTHILAGASVGANCNIGDHCFLESGVFVGNDVTIKNGNAIWDGVTLENGVFVGPSVVFTNDVRPRSPRFVEAAHRYADRGWLLPTLVCRGATLGAGAIIVAGVTIGEYALVAAGAVVTRDVEPHALVVGTPARRCGWVCRCGASLDVVGDQADCPVCGSAYTVSGDRVRTR